MEENLKRIDGERNQEERSFFDPTSWRRPEFVLTCLENEKVCISIGLCGLSAVFWVVACLLVVCKRCRTKRRNVGDTADSALYCFLGNLSGTVGAVMSIQLTIQVFMGGLLTILDILRFIFIIIPFSGRTESRIKVMRKRRRQNIFVLSLPLALGIGLFAFHGLYQQQSDSVPVRRRLLSLVLQDNSEILGYALGLLSTVIGWTSKFPSLTKAHLEKMTSAVHVSFGILCALANVLYGSAILVYDARTASVLKALPWLLNCFGCAAFDVVILGLSCFRMHRGWSWDPTDTQSLLEDSPPEPPSPTHPDSRRPSLQTLRSKKCMKKTAEIGRYMDINIQPVQPEPKVFLKEVKISREGRAGGLLLKRAQREVKEEDPCSSDSSSASSSLHPELEWDFGDANAHWNKVPKPQKRKEVFALRNWRVQLGTNPASQTKADSVKSVGSVETRSCAIAVDQQVAAPGTLPSVENEGPIGQHFAVNGK
ncbi:transmembrane protein 44 isoform X2 [Anguilla anguilla]|uniref:transmembrane protein 44 isoform X1 n=1 Tax=Anguilla anguilla TaxID=7936 RepID=UPI0015A8034B|nr:transmembrane protein 44 isoform X1 [Anguilla anguilla]XP_035268740.1 transmembrane protein 44 isoform X2 [Anguilla anguilla]